MLADMARLLIPTDYSAQVQWNTDLQLYSPRHLHRRSACSPSFGMQAGAAVAYTQAATNYADATVDYAAIGDCTSAAGASTNCTVNAGKAIANGARKCLEHQSHGSEGFFVFLELHETWGAASDLQAGANASCRCMLQAGHDRQTLLWTTNLLDSRCYINSGCLVDIEPTCLRFMQVCCRPHPPTPPRRQTRPPLPAQLRRPRLNAHDSQKSHRIVTTQS